MTIKNLRELFYRQRACAETHELYVSKGDSEEVLREFHEKVQLRIPFSDFLEQVKSGDRDVFLKRVPMNFFSDKPTGFVQVKKYIRLLVDINDERE